MKRACILVLLILAGCGGGSDSRNPTSAGRYTGTWQNVTLNRSGTAEMTIQECFFQEPCGDTTGRLTDGVNTIGFRHSAGSVDDLVFGNFPCRSVSPYGRYPQGPYDPRYFYLTVECQNGGTYEIQFTKL